MALLIKGSNTDIASHNLSAKGKKYIMSNVAKKELVPFKTS